ncbi:MAG: hypothetical protein ACTS78_03160 [Arsenophonus sp. NC-WZS1-MAG3]
MASFNFFLFLFIIFSFLTVLTEFFNGFGLRSKLLADVLVIGRGISIRHIFNGSLR